MTRDDGGTDPSVPVWPAGIALSFAGLVLGLGAALGLAAISWGLPLPGAIVGFVGLLIAVLFARGSGKRFRVWFWMGGTLGLFLGSSYLIWVSTEMAGAF